MTENTFKELEEEEEYDTEQFEDMRLGIQSQLDSSRTIAHFFDFLFQQMRSVISAILGSADTEQEEKKK